MTAANPTFSATTTRRSRETVTGLPVTGRLPRASTVGICATAHPVTPLTRHLPLVHRDGWSMASGSKTARPAGTEPLVRSAQVATCWVNHLGWPRSNGWTSLRHNVIGTPAGRTPSWKPVPALRVDLRTGHRRASDFQGTLRAATPLIQRDPVTGELHAIRTTGHGQPGAVQRRRRRREGAADRRHPSRRPRVDSRHVLTTSYAVIYDLPSSSASRLQLQARRSHTVGRRLREQGRPAPARGRREDVVWCDVDPCYVFIR